jgi:hypothetical protein
MTEAIGNERNQSLGRQRAPQCAAQQLRLLESSVRKKNSKGGAKTEISSSAGNSNKKNATHT